MLRGIPANFTEVEQIIMRRSKIEQWVNELFFEETVVGSLVRLGLNRKYIIAEVREVVEDDSQEYILTNGKSTSKFLRLLITEDKADKLQSFKINQISNSPVTYEEFEKLAAYRNHYKVPQVDRAMVYERSLSLQKARNYVYKDGKTNEIAYTNFEKALRKKDLSAFPNVPFFLKIYQAKLEGLEEKLQIASEENYNRQTDSLLAALPEQIKKLKADIEEIKEHMKKDLRKSKYIDSNSKEGIIVENIEEQEDKKLYYEWLESQAKEKQSRNLLEQMRSKDQKEIGLREKLFLQINDLNRLHAQGIRGQNIDQEHPSEAHSFFARTEYQKKQVVSVHERLREGEAHSQIVAIASKM